MVVPIGDFAWYEFAVGVLLLSVYAWFVVLVIGSLVYLWGRLFSAIVEDIKGE